MNPQGTIPISLTGRWCALNCAHCGARYLMHMRGFEEIDKYAQEGIQSFLLSGGLDVNGKLPFSNAVLRKLRFLKEKYSLQYNFHVGFPDKPLTELKEVADVVSFDFFSDTKIMRKIYGIEVEGSRMIEVMKSMGIFCVPHVTIGVDCGRITHEYRSIEMLSEYFTSVVLNIFVPTFGTFYESCKPPTIGQVKDLFEYAKKLFKIVTLGCMQPKGSYRSALQNELEGIADVIVKPVRRVVNDFDGCCALLLKQISQEVGSNVR
ncbi:MAG TPA: radical SAM protein [Pseudothermotoga sp.]|nr:radical SAM protein [Pseudothermotoga sp.]HOK82689.1 radical SAM protein [Pseudothermotoga sp.]HPP70450.1 radical SAM protein [Pseudothermotoga sp.]